MLAVFVYSMNSLLYLLLGRQRHYETCQCQHYWLDIHQAVNSQHKMTMKIISTHNICLWNGSEHNLIRRESHYMRLSSFEIAVNWYFFSLFFCNVRYREIPCQHRNQPAIIHSLQKQFSWKSSKAFVDFSVRSAFFSSIHIWFLPCLLMIKASHYLDSESSWSWGKIDKILALFAINTLLVQHHPITIINVSPPLVNSAEVFSSECK